VRRAPLIALIAAAATPAPPAASTVVDPTPVVGPKPSGLARIVSRAL